MSLSPPRNPSIGDVWVDPFTAERYIYTGTGEYVAPNGAHLDALDGWIKHGVEQQAEDIDDEVGGWHEHQ
jgi:hypothetical protein